jgi:hypothetical protein
MDDSGTIHKLLRGHALNVRCPFNTAPTTSHSSPVNRGFLFKCTMDLAMDGYKNVLSLVVNIHIRVLRSVRVSEPPQTLLLGDRFRACPLSEATLRTSHPLHVVPRALLELSVVRTPDDNRDFVVNINDLAVVVSGSMFEPELLKKSINGLTCRHLGG